MNISVVLQRTLALASVVLLMASCATPADKQAQTEKIDTQTAMNDYESCLDSIRHSAKFDPLREHIPQKLQYASVEQMADDSEATQNQIRAIYVVQPLTVACRKEVADRLMASRPELTSYLVTDWQNRDEYEAQLVRRRMSWGDFITKSKASEAVPEKEIPAAVQKINGRAEENRDEEADLQTKQQAEKNIAQYFNNQRVPRYNETQ